MKRQIMSVVMLVAVASATFQVYAVAPESAVQHTPNEINYQGRLVKPDGSLVPDGTYTLDIRLYRVPTAGTAAWGGRFSTYVKGGYFNLILGASGIAIASTTYAPNALWRALWPDPAIASGEKNTLFLEVTPIDAPPSHGLTLGSALLPRQNLLAAPYAFRAQTAEFANQSIGNFTVNGAFSAGPSVAFRTYLSGSAPFLDIGVSGQGETKLQSATTRVTSGQLLVSSATQSFTAGAGNFSVNSLAGNINLSGNNATIDMNGNVTIKGAGSLGTMIGSTSKPLVIMGNSVAGRGPLVWNRPNASHVGESPFIIENHTLNIPSGSYGTNIVLPTYTVADYSAMVVGWEIVGSPNDDKLPYSVKAYWVDGETNWRLLVQRRGVVTAITTFKVDVLFVNKYLINDRRTASQVGP